MPELDLRQILATSPTIAVLGIHDEPHRPACYVPAYLADHGYEILGVNPALEGKMLFGNRVVARLADLAKPVDLVDVFRRPAALPDHLDELLALKPPVVWLQQGIRHDAVAAALERAGITVVQDECTLAEHRGLGLGAPRRVDR